MNATQIRAFLLVCEKGSFSRAANEMFISKVAVSKLISSIEKEFSIVCFVRNKTGCTLTKDGETLYKYISQISDIYNKAKHHFASNKPHPIIRLAYDPNKGEKTIYRIRSILNENDFNVALVRTSYYNFFGLIANLAIDFAFVAKPSINVPKSICYNELLTTNIYAMHLKSSHFFNSDIIKMNDLKNIPVYLSPIVNCEKYSSFVKKTKGFHLKSIGINDFISEKYEGVYLTTKLESHVNNDYRLTKIEDLSISLGIAYNIINQQKISNINPIISSAIKKEEL